VTLLAVATYGKEVAGAVGSILVLLPYLRSVLIKSRYELLWEPTSDPGDADVAGAARRRVGAKEWKAPRSERGLVLIGALLLMLSYVLNAYVSAKS
jgi:hypothetical protein